MVFFVPGKRGTVRDNRMFNVSEASMGLYKAMKGLGTDEASVVTIVSCHSFAQRGEIRKKFEEIYKKDLLKELDGELSFTFGKLVLALMSDPHEFILECIHPCVVKKRLGGKIAKKLSCLFNDGMRRTEYCLLSLLCPRTNAELGEIKKAFKIKYKMDLIEGIALGGCDLSVDFTTFLVEFIDEEREEEKGSEVNTDAIERDTDNLIAGGAEAEELFQQMLLKKSWAHLSCVFDAYSMVTGSTIENFIDTAESFSKELKQVYLAVVLLLTNPPVFYADRLRGAIRGAGTDDDTLIRVLILRSEVDLIDIMDVYETKFGISLADDVAGDTSGDYKELLLKIISVPPPIQESEKIGVVKKVARQQCDDDEPKKVQRQSDHVSGESSSAAAVKAAIRKRNGAGRKKQQEERADEECGEEE